MFRYHKENTDWYVFISFFAENVGLVAPVRYIAVQAGEQLTVRAQADGVFTLSFGKAFSYFLTILLRRLCYHVVDTPPIPAIMERTKV